MEEDVFRWSDVVPIKNQEVVQKFNGCYNSALLKPVMKQDITFLRRDRPSPSIFTY